jgi:prevent-host-death family protein
MRTTGIRQARQRLSELILEVKNGTEVTLTERGHAVARLVPPTKLGHKPYRSHRKVRASVHVSGTAMTATISDDREDRF